jgi:hypothetical protein
MKLLLSSDHIWRPLVFILALLVILQLIFSRQVYDVTIYTYRIMQSYYLQDDFKNYQIAMDSMSLNISNISLSTGLLKVLNETNRLQQNQSIINHELAMSSNISASVIIDAITTLRAINVIGNAAVSDGISLLSNTEATETSPVENSNTTCNPVLGKFFGSLRFAFLFYRFCN